MPIPKTLLLIPFIPGATHAGDVFTREILRHYPQGHLCCFAIGPYSPATVPPDEYEGFPLECVRQPAEAGIEKLGTWIKHWHTLAVHYYLRRIQVPQLIRQMVLFGQQHNVDTVWVIVNHHPTMVYIAKAVADQLKARLLVNVHDPPQQFLDNIALKGAVRQIIARWIENRFAEALNSAASVGTASEGMREDYLMNYGIQSATVLIHGLKRELARPPATALNYPDRFIIGFAGSLYAQKEWEALLAALDQINWRIEGRHVMIRLWGGTFTLQARTSRHIEYLGWCSPEKVLDELAQVDVTYLPYWFDAKHGRSVRQCFPNKLSTYLAAGRPVFYHGPKDSSPMQLLQRFPAGVCCHSLDAADIATNLQRLAQDQDFYQYTSLQASKALEAELNLQVFLYRFAMFMGVPPNILGLAKEF